MLRRSTESYVEKHTVPTTAYTESQGPGPASFHSPGIRRRRSGLSFAARSNVRARPRLSVVSRRGMGGPRRPSPFWATRGPRLAQLGVYRVGTRVGTRRHPVGGRAAAGRKADAFMRPQLAALHEISSKLPC